MKDIKSFLQDVLVSNIGVMHDRFRRFYGSLGGCKPSEVLPSTFK